MAIPPTPLAAPPTLRVLVALIGVVASLKLIATDAPMSSPHASADTAENSKAETMTPAKAAAPPTPVRPGASVAAATNLLSDADLVSGLRPICDAGKLPAAAAAIVDHRGIVAAAVVGVRKAGTTVPATLDDHWHLGSDSKAMTATLIGCLIDDGKVKFESTLAELFPELAPDFPAKIKAITVAQLLAHQGGLPHDADYRGLGHGSLVEQRHQVVASLARTTLLRDPGTGYEYSNWGYIILGAIAEKVTGRPWEDLIQDRVFKPLHMEHVGFGGLGTPGKVDQPWPHEHGTPMAENGPAVDNPPVVSPAGRVHCPIGEWAKFIAHELRGLRDEPTLLKPATFRRLHTPEFGGRYAGGWGLGVRAWAHGTTYSHAGSNRLNYCVAWIAPNVNAAYLVCTNTGDGARACDQIIGILAQHDAARRDAQK